MTTYRIERWDRQRGEWNQRGDWGAEEAVGLDFGEAEAKMRGLEDFYPKDDWRVVEE